MNNKDNFLISTHPDDVSKKNSRIRYHFLPTPVDRNIEKLSIYNSNNINLYDGEIPPFMEREITHQEWIKIKEETNKWNDKYISKWKASIIHLL